MALVEFEPGTINRRLGRRVRQEDDDLFGPFTGSQVGGPGVGIEQLGGGEGTVEPDYQLGTNLLFDLIEQRQGGGVPFSPQGSRGSLDPTRDVVALLEGGASPREVIEALHASRGYARDPVTGELRLPGEPPTMVESIATSVGRRLEELSRTLTGKGNMPSPAAAAAPIVSPSVRRGRFGF